jgi:HSP20 family protein
MMTIREKMNRLFEDAVSGRGEEGAMVSGTWAPAVDIYESENEIVLSAEVPGIEDKDIEIRIEDNTLSLVGERRFEKETKEENYHRVERSYGSFVRSFTIPHYVDQEAIRAEHENGVLKVILPKKPEKKPKTVKILKASGEEKTTKKIKK